MNADVPCYAIGWDMAILRLSFRFGSLRIGETFTIPGTGSRDNGNEDVLDCNVHYAVC